jgi:hypothetical protein
MCLSQLSENGGLTAFLRTVFPCLLSLAFSSPLDSQTLSDAEADRIVATEVAESEERKEARIPEYTVLSESTRSIGGESVSIRKVLPPEVPEVEPIEQTLNAEELETILADFERQQALERRTLSMGIRVFDDTFSEITYRRDGRTIRILSNVNFRYLIPFAEVEAGGALYSLVAFVSPITRAAEQARLDRMRGRSLPVEDVELPSAELFSGSDPEYIVYSDGEGEIPGELYRDMEALHCYYVANEAELKEQAQRRKSLAEARKRYEKANPKVKKPKVIHYWKGVGSSREENK